MHRTLTMASLVITLSPALLFAEPLATASTNAKDPLVEVSWSDGDQARARIAVALPLDKACSRVEADHDRSSAQLSVCRIGGDAEAPQLELILERREQASHTSTPSTMKLRATVRMRRGATIPIGRFQRGEQPSEVIAALR